MKYFKELDRKGLNKCNLIEDLKKPGFVVQSFNLSSWQSTLLVTTGNRSVGQQPQGPPYGQWQPTRGQTYIETEDGSTTEWEDSKDTGQKVEGSNPEIAKIFSLC